MLLALEENTDVVMDVEAEPPVVSWTDCLASFKTINMKALAFEQAVESIRAEKLERPTSP